MAALPIPLHPPPAPSTTERLAATAIGLFITLPGDWIPYALEPGEVPA